MTTKQLCILSVLCFGCSSYQDDLYADIRHRFYRSECERYYRIADTHTDSMIVHMHRIQGVDYWPTCYDLLTTQPIGVSHGRP